MGLGGGSASSSSGSKNGSSTSGTGSPYFQNSNPLNPAAVRPSNNFDFTTAPVPSPSQPIDKGFQPQLGNPNKGNVLTPAGSGFMRDIEQNVEGTRTTALERSLQGATQVYDAAQGEGSVDLLQQQAQNRPVDTLTDPATQPYSGIGNNIAVGLNKVYEGLAKIPRFVYTAAAAPQNFLANQLDMPGLAAKYDNFIQMTNASPVVSPLTMLDQLGDYYGEQAEGYAAKTQKYDDTIMGSLNKGNFKQAGSQILDQIAESAPSIAVMAMTSGAGNVAGLSQTSKTLANALPFMSQRNAELQDDASIPEWLKPVNAAANGLAEVIFDQSFGTQAAIQGIVNRFQNEGREAAVNAAKELTGSFLNGALKTVDVIKPFAKGAVEEASTQLAQNIVDKYTVNPEKDLMEGVADAAIVGSAMTGSIETAGNILVPKQRAKIESLEEQQQSLLNELGNENLSPEAKQGVTQMLEDNQTSVEKLVKESKDFVEKLSPVQLKQMQGLNEKIKVAKSVIADPNTSEEVKKAAEQQVANLSKEIDAIKPEEGTKETPQETEIAEVEDNTPDTKQELTDYISQAEEIAVQHEQLAEMETDPVEKEEALEIARNAREVIASATQELTDLNKETIAPKLKTRTGSEEYNQIAARALQSGIKESDYKPVDDFEQYFDDKEIFNIAKNSGLKVVVLTPEMAKNNKLLSGATGKFLYNNTIMIDPEYLDKKYYGANILQHEAAHAFTVSVLQEKNDANLQPEEIEFRDEVKKAFNENKNTLFKPYGLTNELEFVAEFYGNPKFRDYLKNENQPLWRKIIKLISGVLKVDNSKLDKIFGDFKQNLLPSEVKETIVEPKTEKQQEKEERESVFNVPLSEATEAIDALIKKEKDKPDGYGAFIEMKDARESKGVVEKYKNATELSDAELAKDFREALFGNPTTWYADGLKLRESVQEQIKRGKSINEITQSAENAFINDGYSPAEAKNSVAKMLEPILKNATTETSKIPNEIKQPEVATEEVVAEDLSQKRNEEVLAKAEDDLKALKQVTDKTKKYEASMKRITEAKNNKEISVAEFNDLKKRFDDVIGESKPKVKEEPKDAVQIESTASVDVREPSKDGGEVEQGNAEEQETTRETGSKEVPVTSKEEKKVSEDFRKLVHKNIQSDEVSNTLSNVERETGRELTEEEREYRVTRRNDALNHGANVIEMAKEEFGKTYVSDLLNYLNENASTISLENRALINISLELDLERQLLEDPDNTTLNKQLKLVRDASTKFQRSAAIATGYGILRQIARVGYDINQVTDQFFSEQQLADKAKLTKAIESTPDDINKEAEIQEEDTDPLEDFNIKPKDRKKKFGLTEAQQQEKAELAKQFRGVFNDVTRIATLLADKKFMRYAKLVFLDTAGDFETFAKNMIETVGEGIKKHLPIIYEKVGGTDGVTEKTEAQKQKAKSIKDIVKKALIDKGYGREITVTTNERDEDGKKIKEKRKVLDWKKLAGEEGSVENIKANVESALKNSGYSDSDIELIQQGLTAEYNRLHASIIEKSLNELQSRNQDREPINVKTSAKKLAELYNYGLFDEQSDTYDNIINRALGLSAVGQKAFEEAKVLAKALSDIYRSTDSSGRRISEFGLKDAIRSINAEIERLLTDVAWEQSNMAFKVATVAKEFMGLSQRAMLQTIKQILENPLSGFIQRSFTKIGYSRDGTDTKALSKKRSEAARIVYEDIVRNAGLNYGEIITPFVTRGAFEKKLERLSDNKIYHTALSALLGRAYLDGADSMHKSALTERYFVHNLVRVLVKKGMAKEAAIEFVSNQLTGQKFTDALGSAKQIIDKANEDAGKRIINDNPNAIYRLAQNIVKDALVVGENITLREVESSYKAAYKAAGYDLGHEANNIVSETVAGATTKLENAIKQAVKDKKWNHATALTFTSILTKNIINPFVSGGTNWIVLSLQKAGVDVISPIVDYARQKENKLDLTTKEGVKNMENALLSEMRYKNTINRVVIGAMASTLIAAAAIASGEDDDLAAWLKKNDWAKKYFKVISPQALIVLVARENKQLADYLIGLFGFSYESYSDANKLIQAFQGLSADKKKSQEKGYRKLGEVFGGHTSFPTPWRVARDVENIYRGTQGKKPVKPDYNKGDFWDGYLRNGVIEYFMLER